MQSSTSMLFIKMIKQSFLLLSWFTLSICNGRNAVATALRGVDIEIGAVEEALCYAERYSYLRKRYCNGDLNSCDVDKLSAHYEEKGKAKHLIWGCFNHETTIPKPVVDKLPFADQARIQSDELLEPLELHVLILETEKELVDEMIARRQTTLAGINTTIYGIGEPFRGYGTKWSLVLPVLRTLPDYALVAIVDGRDVLLNIPEEDFYSANGNVRSAVQSFVMAYRSLTFDKPGSIVMSAEAQCCVNALTHVQPGDYFDPITGRRSTRACASGEPGCGWEGDTFKLPWLAFQEDLARKHNDGSVPNNAYLNAGMVAGRPIDLINVIQTADIQSDEDDQAVFTDLMYHRPDLIVLDYASELFGVTRWSQGMEGGGCVFDTLDSSSSSETMGTSHTLLHVETHTSPLFLHTPGHFYDCFNSLATKLQIDTAFLLNAKSLATRQLASNYGGSEQLYCQCIKNDNNKACRSMNMGDDRWDDVDCRRVRNLVDELEKEKEENGEEYFEYEEGEFVTVCHLTFGEGNQVIRRTITVHSTDLAVYLAHGDSLGKCSPTDEDETEYEEEDDEEDDAEDEIEEVQFLEEEYDDEDEEDDVEGETQTKKNYGEDDEDDEEAYEDEDEDEFGVMDDDNVYEEDEGDDEDEDDAEDEYDEVGRVDDDCDDADDGDEMKKNVTEEEEEEEEEEYEWEYVEYEYGKTEQ